MAPSYKPLKEVEDQNEYTGVIEWNEKGLTGLGVNVWNCEAPTPSHGEITERRVYDAAPGCKVYTAPSNVVASNDRVETHTVEYDGKTYDIEEFIKEKKIKILTKSIGGKCAEGSSESKYWNGLKEKYNLIFFNSAGNDGYKEIGGAFPADVAIYVGACTLAKGKPVRASYSSVGEALDFMAFVGVWSGTSFASPYLAGMCALICQAYPMVTQGQIYSYFVKNSIDMLDQGRDCETGFGLAKMGKIENMLSDLGFVEDPNKNDRKPAYMELIIPVGSNVARKCLKYDENEDYCSIEDITLDQPAIIDKSTNRTLVPVRFVAETLDCEVSWNNKERAVIIKKRLV